MSLYKRGRIWWGKFTAPGSAPARESSGTSDRAAAQEWHDRRAAELWRIRRLGERPRIALAAVIADWLTTHGAGKRSAETDRTRLRVLLPLLPDWLDELTTTRMRQIRDTLRAPRTVELVSRTGTRRTVTRTMGEASANKYLSLLSGILRHAHAAEQIAALPHVPSYQRKRRARRFTVLTFEPAAALLAALPPHLRAMARFALATGLRDANVRGLRWRDVDLGLRQARVWGEDAKAGAGIPVPLSDAAIEVLQGQLGQHDDYVFVYRHGMKGAPRPITKRSNNTAWRNARARVGLPALRWHDLRHAWATWHKLAGTPDHELQVMGGWSDGRMVRTYAHLAASHLLPHANAIRVPGTVQGTVPAEASAGAGDHAGKDEEKQDVDGVADGIRTHNNWNHNAVRGRVIAIESKTSAQQRRRKTGTDHG